MEKFCFALLSIFIIIHTTLADHDIFLIRRGQNGDVTYYLNNLAAIPKDLMKNNQPKEDCVFYVNSYNSTREKNAAIAFAEIRNAQLRAEGAATTANTLYDAFDDVAFGNSGTLMREAQAGGPDFLRTYFKVTSGEYAKLCRGTVWLIVKKDSSIYHDAIWLTHEYPQLIRPGSGVTAIYEIDPAEIEAAMRLNDLTRNLNPTPYTRGGHPPGSTPPRSTRPIPYHPSSKSIIDAQIAKYASYPDVANGYLNAERSAPPECDMSKSSQVPYNVFNGVFGRFCKSTLDNPLNSLAQIVDSQGYVIPHKKRSLTKRTPPPNPNSYIDYKFSLSWSGGKGSCNLGCNDAFHAATASPCGHTAGQQNIMSTSGTIGAGCGEYKWTIIKPPTSNPPPSPPKVSAVKCNSPDAFKNHKDVNPGFQSRYTGYACVGSAKKNIKPGDPEISFRTVTNGTPYNYKISWISNCKSTVSEMNVYQPLQNDKQNTCISLLHKAYTDCK